MHERDLEFPSAADLAAIEAELPEWERLRVRDYWDAVVSEELGKDAAPEDETRGADLHVLSSDDFEPRRLADSPGDQAA